MAAPRRPRLVDVIRKALSDGPVPRDALLTAVRQAGLRADEGVLWETCRVHGLADLEDDQWVPRGWAAPIAAPAGGGTSERRRTAGSTVDRSLEEQGDDTGAEAVTIWVEPEPDGHLPGPALHARHEGINVRPCAPILESGAVIGDVVWSAADSLCGPHPGLVLRTEHRMFADAVRRARRRRPGHGSRRGSRQRTAWRPVRTLPAHADPVRAGAARRTRSPLRIRCDRRKGSGGGR